MTGFSKGVKKEFSKEETRREENQSGYIELAEFDGVTAKRLLLTLLNITQWFCSVASCGLHNLTNLLTS